MPFIALNKDTKDRIDITAIDDPRLTIPKGSVICQLCEQPMIIKAGQVIQAHFAHKVSCTSDYEHKPESAEHLKGKKYVHDYFADFYKDCSGIIVEYEARLPEVKRVADVLITFPMGWQVAGEVQLSPITVDEIQQRTNDYLSLGIDVMWFLGAKADKENIRNWCLENIGVFLTLNMVTLKDAVA